MSGHSKWTQIKHKKAITDAKKGKLFSKMVREITIAAKLGGPSDSNPRLRGALERARASGLPKDNIERAITKATGGNGAVDLHEFLLEALGPGGIQILIEGITDNTNRTFAEVRHLLSERDARLAEPGSVSWNFEKIGIIALSKNDNAAKSKDEIELAIIESGARDFSSSDEEWIVETDFSESERVRKALEEKGAVIKETGHDFKPKNSATPDEKTLHTLESLLDAITDHDDVQEVYTNLAE